MLAASTLLMTFLTAPAAGPAIGLFDISSKGVRKNDAVALRNAIEQEISETGGTLLELGKVNDSCLADESCMEERLGDTELGIYIRARRSGKRLKLKMMFYLSADDPEIVEREWKKGETGLIPDGLVDTDSDTDAIEESDFVGGGDNFEFGLGENETVGESDAAEEPTPEAGSGPEKTSSSSVDDDSDGGIHWLVWTGAGIAGAGTVIAALGGTWAFFENGVLADENSAGPDKEGANLRGLIAVGIAGTGATLILVGAGLAGVGLFLPE